MKDGFIQQDATPQEVFNHPYSLFVASFIGSPRMNLFDSKLVKVDGKYVVELGGQTVVLSDEKQEKLAANNVEEQEIVLEQGIVGKVDVSELMGSSVHLHI